MPAPKGTSIEQGATPMEPLYFDPDFVAVVEEHPTVFFTGMEWRGSFRVEIFPDLAMLMARFSQAEVTSAVEARTAAKAAKAASDLEAHLLGQRRRAFTRFLPPVIGETARAFLRQRPAPAAAGTDPVRLRWQDVVVCPACRGDLAIDEIASEIGSTSCGRRFTIRPDGIPSFITDER